MAVDRWGNVFLTGNATTDTFPSHYDYRTVAFSAAGVPLWTNYYNGPGNYNDVAQAVAVDNVGNVYVTGYSLAADNDFATIKYSGATLLPIPLNYQIAANQLVLSWNNAAFSLQSAPTVQGNYTNISGATSPHTNALSGTQHYFRLKVN